MSLQEYPVHGAGLGLRRALLGPLRNVDGPLEIDFFEVAPENWINVGGALGRQLRSYTERFDFVCHGLSLSLGGPSPLDETFIRKVRKFLDAHQVRYYSEHLSYCTDDGHLYDLMPIPFSEAAIDHVVERILRTQELLGRTIAIENVSYYAAPGKEMDEIEFINEVLQRSDCRLLLDINNIYVNSVNHGYDAGEFLAALPGERVAYCHMAGHYDEAADLIVDTHGAAVIDPVWKLLERAYELFGPMPTLIERDFNFPPLAELLGEVAKVRAIQARHGDEREPRRGLRHG